MKSGRHNRRLFHWRKCSCVSTKTKVLAESFVWAAMLDVDVIQHGRPIQNSVIILEILNFLNYSYFAKIMTRKPKIGSLTNMTELLVYLVSWWRDATWKPIIISLQLLLSCCVYRNCSRDPVKKKRRKKKKKGTDGVRTRDLWLAQRLRDQRLTTWPPRHRANMVENSIFIAHWKASGTLTSGGKGLRATSKGTEHLSSKDLKELCVYCSEMLPSRDLLVANFTFRRQTRPWKQTFITICKPTKSRT